MPIDALPEKLQKDPLPEGDGTDQDNAAQKYFSRAWTAFGPRVERQRWTWARVGIPWTRASIPVCPALARWRMFPVVLAGYNVNRWMGVEDKSIIFVGRFVQRFIWWGTDFYQVPAIEREPGNPKFDESFTAMIRGRWWWTEREQHVTKYVYGPSPIQNFAFGWSWALTWPLHFAISYRKKREGKADFVFFFRVGARWDSLDMYYTFPSFFLGLAWN